jgi:hypothetical protein
MVLLISLDKLWKTPERRKEESSPVDLARAARFSIFLAWCFSLESLFYFNILDSVLPPTAEIPFL